MPMDQALTIDDKLYHLLTQYLTEQIKKNHQTTGQRPEIDFATTMAARWHDDHLVSIKTTQVLPINELVNVETQRRKLMQNTEQFLNGLPANHVLLTGARGVGKSALIRAVLQHYASQGLRLIEVSSDQLYCLPRIIQVVASIPYRFIIYCDDIAFNYADANYRELKSVLDGALDSDSDQVLIYATSNRRHLLPQMMQDNMQRYHQYNAEVNPRETEDETVSLSDRFGLWLSFYPVDQATYLDIVEAHLQSYQFKMDAEVRRHALRWASERGSRSGRIAAQFARHWTGKQLLAQRS